MRLFELIHAFGFLIFVYMAVTTSALPGKPALAQQSADNVRTLSPAGAIKPTGTWNLGTRTRDFIHVAGMRGIDPTANLLVEGDEARVRQAFLNMKLIAESEGATLQDAVRLVVYVADMYRHRPLVNKVQQELWGNGPYPPRTIIELDRLNQDDIVEVEGTFYAPIGVSSTITTAADERNSPESLLQEYQQWLLLEFRKWLDDRQRWRAD